ncbi:MAG TPA: RNA methyltransferase [Chitinophagaceae bacterium]
MLVKSQVKYIQSLGQKKHRDEADVFIAEGPKIVAELLATAMVQQVYAVKEWIEENTALIKHTEAIEISQPELEKISQLSTPNQVLALVKKFDTTAPLEAKGRITLVLDTIQDPGNMGTIIRTADWFGISQIVCSNECADIYNPKVVQSTMGSIARVKVIYADLARWLGKQHDVHVYAAMLEGQDVKEMKSLQEAIIVIGNESKGISEEIIKLVNVKITIPQKGKAESLNAAVATGIILSHVV